MAVLTYLRTQQAFPAPWRPGRSLDPAAASAPRAVADDGFRDPAGRDGLVFGVTPAKVLVFGKSPYSQTRYRFTA